MVIVRSGQRLAFMSEKPFLGFESTGIATQLAIAPHDSVARDDNGNGVAPVRCPHGPRCTWFADLYGDLPIRSSDAKRNLS